MESQNEFARELGKLMNRYYKTQLSQRIKRGIAEAKRRQDGK